MLRISIRFHLPIFILCMILVMAGGSVLAYAEESTVISSDQLSVLETTAPVTKLAPETKIPDLATTAKGAVLLDANTGTILYEKNSHEKLPPASITKIMTMLLVMEAVDRGQITLEDPVTISERAASMGGSQMYMEPGEEQQVETLLKGMAIGSANDACVACAEYVGGTEEIFVEQMNKRAQELGMKDTHFANTNGLPVADHYTSAYDIGLMSKELIKHSKVFDWLTTWQTTVLVGLAGKEQTEFGLTNTNRLIKLYPGANGIKTGFTQEAGYCLSGSATKGDLTLISVVLGCETTQKRWGESIRLLDYGFATYESAKVAQKGEILGTIRIEKGDPSEVNAIAPDDIHFLMKKGDSSQVTRSAILFNHIKAPIKAGDAVGELVVLKENQELGRYPLTAENDVKPVGLLKLYIRMFQTLI